MHHTPSQMSCLMLHGALLCDGYYSILHFEAVLISYAIYRLNLLFTEGYSFLVQNSWELKYQILMV